MFEGAPEVSEVVAQRLRELLLKIGTLEDDTEAHEALRGVYDAIRAHEAAYVLALQGKTPDEITELSGADKKGIHWEGKRELDALELARATLLSLKTRVNLSGMGLFGRVAHAMQILERLGVLQEGDKDADIALTVHFVEWGK